MLELDARLLELSDACNIRRPNIEDANFLRGVRVLNGMACAHLLADEAAAELADSLAPRFAVVKNAIWC